MVEPDRTDPESASVPGAEDSSPAVSRPGLARALARAGGRGAVGIIGIGIAVATIAAATLIPAPQLGEGAQSMLVTPVAAPQQRICPGPVLQLGDDTGQDATTAISIGRADVTRDATVGSPQLENMDATENATNTPSQRLVLAPPEPDAEPGILAGSQSQRVDSADDVGFAASECVKAATESWLVGGSTITGRTTLLSLNNPSKVNSTVNVTIYSESGLVSATGTEGIVVPPGGRRVFSLAAFAPGITSPVVRVESIGGQIAASMQQSIVRTLTPGGIDVFTATTSPEAFTVIPGIVTMGQRDVARVSGQPGYADLTGALRVFVPGKGNNSITVTAIPEDGSGPGTSSNFTVQRGVVTDLPLGDFDDGTWTLTVASENPAVVAARTSTVTLDGAPSDAAAGSGDGADSAAPSVTATDFAWFVGAPEIESRSLVSVAPGPNPVLHLVNSGSSDASVTIDGEKGAGTTVTIPAGEARAVPVAAATSYNLGGFASLRVAVSYRGDAALAGFVVSPPDRSALPVRVYHQFG